MLARHNITPNKGNAGTLLPYALALLKNFSLRFFRCLVCLQSVILAYKPIVDAIPVAFEHIAQSKNQTAMDTRKNFNE